MRRYELTDEQWALIEPLLPPQRGNGRPYRDHRTSGAISNRWGTAYITIEQCEILMASNNVFTGPGYSSRVFEETGVYTGRYGVRDLGHTPR